MNHRHCFSHVTHTHTRSSFTIQELHSRSKIDCLVTKKSPIMLEFIYKWPTYNAWLNKRTIYIQYREFVYYCFESWHLICFFFHSFYDAHFVSFSVCSHSRSFCVTISVQFIWTNLLDEFHENCASKCQRITFSNVLK